MATTFLRFNDLPPELRLQIWIFTLPPPHSLLIEKKLVVKQNKVEPWARSMVHSITRFFDPPPRPVPAVLHVCQESRSEFLKVEVASAVGMRRLNTGHRLFEYYTLGCRVKQCFFEVENDEVVLTMNTIYNRFHYPCARLRNLVLITDSTHFYPSRAADFLLPFSNLRLLTLVLNITVIGSHEARNRVFPPEIDGEFDLEGFSVVRRHDLRDEIKRINEALDETERRSAARCEIRGEKWKRPRVKWRLWEQFVREMRIAGGDGDEDRGLVERGTRPNYLPNKFFVSWMELENGNIMYGD